jgi:two-component system, cell cycle sensor histidine kinase and response regulator CckA
VETQPTDHGIAPPERALQREVDRLTAALAELRESEARFAKIFQLMPEIVSITRLRDGLVLDVNASFESATGYTRAEVLGCRTTDLALWVDHSERDRMLAALQSTGEVTRLPVHLRTKDGLVRPSLFSARVLDLGREPALLSLIHDISDQHASEEALRVSEKRLRQIIDLVPHFIFAKDADGRFILVNQAVARAYGTTVEQLTGRTDADFANSNEEVRHFRTDDLEVIHSGRPKVVPEEKITEASGQVRTLSTVKIPFTFSGTSSPALLGVAVDITERRRAEAALRESEERYKRLFETAGDAIFIMSQDRFIDCNLHTLEMFACMRAEIIGHSPDEFSPPRQPDGRDSREKSLEKIDAAMQGQPQRFEWVHLRKDGRQFIAEVTLNTIQLAAGRHLQAIVRDITERKAAENALQRSEAKYRMLAENVADVIWTTDLDLRVTYVSPSITKAHGGTPEEWIGRSVEEYIVPDSLARVRSTLAREMEKVGREARDASHVVTLEVEQRRVNGDSFWTEVTAQFVLDEHGRPSGIIGVTRDISERRQAESERRQLEERLAQAEKMESVGRLAGGVAHDLNNMLTPILGYAELLTHELPSEDARRPRVQEILAAGERCRALVQRLLAFARKQTLKMRPLDLNDMVRGMQPMLRRTFRENIALELRLDPTLKRIEGDPTQIEQILLNLAVNAQDAMPDGGVITLATERIVPPDGAGAEQKPQACLLVSDTGIGMDEATQAHLFEPFFTTKSVGRGTGLGLSTVYGIVRQHHGTISVESQPGLGTCFRILFPETDRPAARPRGAGHAQLDTAGRGTVLVVEDEAMVLTLITEVLHLAGYSVLQASDCRSAVELARAHGTEIDLLLTDVILPDENGRVLHALLQEMLPDLPVLFMSGYTADVIGHHGVLAPGVNYIQKPFATGALTAKIAEVLQLQ